MNDRSTVKVGRCENEWEERCGDKVLVNEKELRLVCARVLHESMLLPTPMYGRRERSEYQMNKVRAVIGMQSYRMKE